MTSLKNDTLLKALKKQETTYTPIWLMRQAGRYLPEYRKAREQAGSFLNLCKTPELACEVTLQPLKRFKLDAAILFSDILTIPDAMGLGLEFREGEGPIFQRPLNTIQDIDKLYVPDPSEKLQYVMDAVSLITQALDHSVPLIGFAGSPWTLACYMVEGGASQLFKKIKTLIYDQPQATHNLLSKLASAVTLYLQAQIAAGVDVVMLFDTWGGILTTADYHTFSLHYMQQIVSALKQSSPNIPIILFTKYGGQWLEAMADTGCTAIGIDWTVDIQNAYRRVGSKVALQGNLDPMILFAQPAIIEQQVAKILQAYGRQPGHIFNLGHGIDQHTPIEHVQVLVETVHAVSKTG